MARPRKLRFSLPAGRQGFVSYLRLIKYSIIKPRTYAKAIQSSDGEIKSIKKPIAFFIINFSIGLLLGILIDAVTYKNPQKTFFLISEVVLYIPVAFFTIIFIALILHGLAVILGGKGSFKSSLATLSFASTPIIFFRVPFLNALAFLVVIYTLILKFEQIHQYSFFKAFLNLALPLLILVLIGLTIGIESVAKILW